MWLQISAYKSGGFILEMTRFTVFMCNSQREEQISQQTESL